MATFLEFERWTLYIEISAQIAPPPFSNKHTRSALLKRYIAMFPRDLFYLTQYMLRI